MRKRLPDLFDAQPDLLFQLVTMLNPSVLQGNEVPVYSVLQEPGNFIITFPKSYHGGFNFGLNCAEAVNFAPADWLPHGGFGAELYRLYRRPAVLSHEELLCVVAESDFDAKASPYLKKELLRIYNKERTCRERLWRNDFVKSSPMSPRKQPKFVGVEEDQTCIICQQFLYLSAVGCRCRPSAFVCLEHWEHLCECKPHRHRLLYRHTLSELNDLVLATEKHNNEEITRNRNIRKQSVGSYETGTLSKKVKGVTVTLVQLGEEWLLRSCEILQKPYSSKVFVKALKEAQQFLWAGSELDPVREMARKLAEAVKWAENVSGCLAKIESWLCDNKRDIERVKMEDVKILLSINPWPCNLPGLLKLKGYEEEARTLIQEINSMLSTSSNVSIVEWEALYSRACDSAIHVKESEILSCKLSSAKSWIDSVRECVSENCSAVTEVDVLYSLKSQISELHVQVPEVELLLDFISRAESCRSRCNEMLRGSITLKKLEVFAQEFGGFTVNIPELKLLWKYHSDALTWISRFNNVVRNAHERKDQENVVSELFCIQKDGSMLKVEVDELLRVEVELKKASCRVEALKALRCTVTVDFIRLVISEAELLHIEKEKWFSDISEVLAAALLWEEKATLMLASKACVSEFEDAIRTSEDLCCVLPSFNDVKEALVMAKSWLIKSKPFLVAGVPSSSSLLKLEILESLVLESKLLKVSMEEQPMLQVILNNCVQWEQDAHLLLHDAECLLNFDDVGGGKSGSLISKVELQVARLKSVLKDDFSLRFDFAEITNLQDACCSLQWCFKAISLCAVAPGLEEVKMLLEAANHIPVTLACHPLPNLLIAGLTWLKKALEISVPCNLSRFKLSDAEEVLRQSQQINLSFPMITARLLAAVKEHNLWVDQVQIFFDQDCQDQSWFFLLELKELGSTVAFDSSDLDRVLSEVQKVERWKLRCEDISGIADGDGNARLVTLLKLKNTLHRSFDIYGKSSESRHLCMYCSSDYEDQELLTCTVCNDCYHMRCLKSALGSSHAIVGICPYCHFVKSGTVCRSKIGCKSPELNVLIDLLSDAENLCVRLEETSILHQIVERSLACRACLVQIVEFCLASCDMDLRSVVCKLSTALKAVEAAGVYDCEVNCKLELALAKNSWRVRAGMFSDGSHKPAIQQIQRHLKEGLAISITSEDYFWQKLIKMKHIGLQWADKAMKVLKDSGALELERVFELISVGENLPVHFEKELKLLQERSMLYCICRKPYDQRAMIACDKCDEWYHFDCINLTVLPKSYICPACKLETDENNSTSRSLTQERLSGKFEEPQTPSPRGTELRSRLDKSRVARKRKVPETGCQSRIVKHPSGIERLFWRNRKPFRRAVRKRVELNALSPLFSAHH